MRRARIEIIDYGCDCLPIVVFITAVRTDASRIPFVVREASFYIVQIDSARSLREQYLEMSSARMSVPVHIYLWNGFDAVIVGNSSAHRFYWNVCNR